MIDTELASRIRGIFLHPESRVTVAEATRLLGWTRAQMDHALAGGEIEAIGTCRGRGIELRELAAYAVHEWPLHVIEEALGREAALILPPALRTRKLTVRLPVYLVQMVGILAAEGGQSVDMYLELMFHELAGNEKERLAGRIPAIEEAYFWPNDGPPQLVS